MGIYLKALVVTTLLMEITTLVALTAVWAILSELHVAGVIVSGALVLTGVMLFVPAVVVFRRAVDAERRMAAETCTNGDQAAILGSPDPLTPPNLLGTAMPRSRSRPARPGPEKGVRPTGR